MCRTTCPHGTTLGSRSTIASPPRYEQPVAIPKRPSFGGRIGGRQGLDGWHVGILGRGDEPVTFPTFLEAAASGSPAPGPLHQPCGRLLDRSLAHRPTIPARWWCRLGLGCVDGLCHYHSFAQAPFPDRLGSYTVVL